MPPLIESSVPRFCTVAVLLTVVVPPETSVVPVTLSVPPMFTVPPAKRIVCPRTVDPVDRLCVCPLNSTRAPGSASKTPVLSPPPLHESVPVSTRTNPLLFSAWLIVIVPAPARFTIVPALVSTGRLPLKVMGVPSVRMSITPVARLFKVPPFWKETKPACQVTVLGFSHVRPERMRDVLLSSRVAPAVRRTPLPLTVPLVHVKGPVTVMSLLLLNVPTNPNDGSVIGCPWFRLKVPPLIESSVPRFCTVAVLPTLTVPPAMSVVPVIFSVPLMFTVPPAKRTISPRTVDPVDRLCVCPLNSTRAPGTVSKTPLLSPPPVRLSRPVSARTNPLLFSAWLIVVVPVPARFTIVPALVSTGRVLLKVMGVPSVRSSTTPVARLLIVPPFCAVTDPASQVTFPAFSHVRAFRTRPVLLSSRVAPSVRRTPLPLTVPVRQVKLFTVITSLPVSVPPLSSRLGRVNAAPVATFRLPPVTSVTPAPPMAVPAPRV